ncbi:MAG TPA: trehalose-phosphatase [Usitatibacter sp.]|nr:trehalose-phosphatase [Usitatibacter sp.]
MRLLNPGTDLEAFFSRVARAPERVLFLDYDGTLAPFHPDPSLAVPYDFVPERLKALTGDQATRVVIVSGRPLGELRPLLETVTHHEAWGAHGWEHHTPEAGLRRFEPEATALRQLTLAEAPARLLEAEGARVERKLASVAMHWRGLPEAQARDIGERIVKAWKEIADANVELLPFEGGMELRVRGRTKANAVKEVLARTSPQAACAYLGDDITDEDAFAAIGGRGLAVLVGPELRRTSADLWIRPPKELERFLERWAIAANPS